MCLVPHTHSVRTRVAVCASVGGLKKQKRQETAQSDASPLSDATLPPSLGREGGGRGLSTE